MTELWYRLQAFFEILFSRNVLTELAAVAFCLLLGWFVGGVLRR